MFFYKVSFGVYHMGVRLISITLLYTLQLHYSSVITDQRLMIFDIAGFLATSISVHATPFSRLALSSYFVCLAHKIKLDCEYYSICS